MPDDKKPGPLDLGDGPPPIGHNNPPADIDAVDGPRNPEDVAALAGAYMRTLGDLARRYMDSPATQTNEGLQATAVQTLGATMHFLTAIGASGEQLTIIQKMMTSVTEVGSGRRVKWLEPSGKRGRTAGVPEDVAVVRAAAAAAMQILVDRGWPTTKAAHEIASRVPRGSVAFAGTDVHTSRWKNVKRWRDDCSASGSGDIGMRDLYRQMLERERERPGVLDFFLKRSSASFLRDPSD
jgi:hypothetical protein